MNESWIERFEKSLHQFETLAARSADFPAVRAAAFQTAGCLGDDPDLQLYLLRPDASEAIQSDGSTLPAPEISVTQFDANPTAVVESLADQIQLIVALQFDKVQVPAKSVPDAVQAIAAVFATYISRQLLNQFQTEFVQQAQLMTVLQRLIGARSRTEIANIVAQDAAACLGDVRVSVIEGEGKNQRLLAATGVDLIDQDSDAVRNLKNQATGEAASSAAVVDLLGTFKRPTRIVIDGAGYEGVSPSTLHLLKTATEEALSKTHSTWLSRLFPQSRRRGILLVAAIAMAICVWPVDFEIEVLGQMQPVESRNIFATDDGVIESVLFTNEQKLSDGQKYLVIRNEQIEREIQELLSKTESAQTRLATVTALKLSGTDPNASVNERLIQTELNGLKEELKTARTRQKSLTLTSPFTGFVYRQDPESTLLNRPVIQGQRLGEIVKQDTAWRVELQIPDDQRAYIDTVDPKTQRPLSVRFYLRSAPDREYHGSLTQIENAAQYSSSELTTRAIVSQVTVTSEKLRPGMSVVGRVYCGRRSAGFVWFREVIELAGYLKFAFGP